MFIQSKIKHIMAYFIHKKRPFLVENSEKS